MEHEMGKNIDNKFKKGDFVKMISNNKIYVILSNGRLADGSKKIVYVYLSFDDLIKKHPLDIINGNYKHKYLTDDMVEKFHENEIKCEKWMIDLCKLNASIQRMQ